MDKETNAGGIHLVDGNDKLTDTEGECQEGMLTGLTVFGDTGFELTSTSGNDKDGTVSLRGTGDHVFDEVTVSRGVNNLCKSIRLANHSIKN